jgi:hypothetical protein
MTTRTLSNASQPEVDRSADGNEKLEASPFRNAYNAPDPVAYMSVGEQSYSPELPDIPSYCNTILDCSALFGIHLYTSTYKLIHILIHIH